MKKINTYISFASTSREPRMRNLYAADDAYWGAAIPMFSTVQLNDTTWGFDFNSPLAKTREND